MFSKYLLQYFKAGFSDSTGYLSLYLILYTCSYLYKMLIFNLKITVYLSLTHPTLYEYKEY